MSSVRKSLALSALDSYLGLVLQIATTVIMARLLTPAEVGTFAVAAVFAALASTFRDFGVAEYLIQEKELDDNALRAALTVNIAISWLMALTLFLLAPAASSFYGSPGVGDVMRVQSMSFILIPFGAVTMAWFRREMNFVPVLVSGLAASIGAFCVGVFLALRGFGYMSLAWSSLAGVVVTVAVSVLYKPRHLPSRPGLKGVRKVIHFGKFASGIYIFGQLGKGAPEMVIGRALDLASVGMFSRAYGLQPAGASRRAAHLSAVLCAERAGLRIAPAGVSRRHQPPGRDRLALPGPDGPECALGHPADVRQPVDGRRLSGQDPVRGRRGRTAVLPVQGSHAVNRPRQGQQWPADGHSDHAHQRPAGRCALRA